jgi:rhodanese-related sulfurtransferase
MTDYLLEGIMKKIILIIALVAVFGAGGYFYQSNQPTKVANPLPMPETGEITVEHAAPLFANGLPKDYAVVDVRTVEEYASKNTPRTINIPVAIFEDADDPCAEVAARLPKDKKIIFVCPYGPRSKEMYGYMTESVEDLGCGQPAEGLYHLWANIKYKNDRIIVKGK